MNINFSIFSEMEVAQWIFPYLETDTLLKQRKVSKTFKALTHQEFQQRSIQKQMERVLKNYPLVSFALLENYEGKKNRKKINVCGFYVFLNEQKKITLMPYEKELKIKPVIVKSTEKKKKHSYSIHKAALVELEPLLEKKLEKFHVFNTFKKIFNYPVEGTLIGIIEQTIHINKSKEWIVKGHEATDPDQTHLIHAFSNFKIQEVSGKDLKVLKDELYKKQKESHKESKVNFDGMEVASSSLQERIAAVSSEITPQQAFGLVLKMCEHQSKQNKVVFNQTVDEVLADANYKLIEELEQSDKIKDAMINAIQGGYD